MNAPLPEGYVAHLPPLKHRFDNHVWIPAAKSASGFSQTERSCVLCGAIKVTIHGPGDNHRRAWRKSTEAEQIETFTALPCEPKVLT
jgi:hypothetical protein